MFPLFMVAVIIHEVSHGWVALAFGDPTARIAGRLTLNPLRHVDSVGTVLLPVALLLLGAPFVFGWARPVPVNPAYFRRPRRGMLWVGLAGPAANFALAVVLALLLHGTGDLLGSLARDLIRTVILINLVLGVFNLLPIPPLDGSRILAGLVPLSWAKRVMALERWGILIVVVLLWFGLLRRVLWPAVLFLARLLGV